MNFKIFITGIAVLTLFWASADGVIAIVDPLERDNNIFGIHITDESDIEGAKKLINSNGGDWGYVTLVIRADDRNKEKWQKTFDLLRENHLIPIVRLAASFDAGGGYWRKPDPNEADGWVNFLDSLNWVVRNRYVILFNEPNHAKEWGGTVSPQEYAKVAKEFSKKLKAKSEDFFVLPAGLDAAAPDGSETMSFTQYIKWMHSFDNEIFSYFDGWNSHSYPNPHFTASPYKTGLSSIKSYMAEIYMVSRYGLDQAVPIFITETGWRHNGGNNAIVGLTEKKIAEYYQIAHKNIWIEPRIVAITPFIYNYQGDLFAPFSWKKMGSDENHLWYEHVEQMSKTKGRPEQYNVAMIANPLLPEELITNRSYLGSVTVTNIGQSIWEPNTLKPRVTHNPNGLDISISSNAVDVKPLQSIKLPMIINTDSQPSEQAVSWEIDIEDKSISSVNTFETVVRPPGIFSSFRLWLFQRLHKDNFSVR